VAVSTEAASTAVAVDTGKHQPDMQPEPLKEYETMRSNIIAIPLLALPLAAFLQVCEAQQASPKTFASAEEASHALFVAVEADATGAVTQILGENNELTGSSDADQDKAERAQFVRKYREMHRLARQNNGEVVLYIGAENWPFPIPLVSHNGVWQYDSDTGEKEVLYRRIGANEVAAIEACHELIANLEKPRAPDSDNPAGPLLTAARADNKPVPYQGYAFRLLSKPGHDKFGIVAYPTVYGSSGVMTFIVNSKGVVYQKDLGPGTQSVATAMAAYPADSTWVPAEAGLEGPG
jgi:Protein of unknown function (DUF2950)